MEILEIRSTHDLTSTTIEKRSAGVHSYQVNCSQFTSTHRTWQHAKPNRTPALWVMTLGFERICITAEEGEKVAAAIQTTSSPVAID